MEPEQNDEEQVTHRAAGRISAHLDVGTIVTGILGAVLSFLVHRGISNLDTLTAEVGKLNQQVAVIRESYAARKAEEERKRAEAEARKHPKPNP